MVYGPEKVISDVVGELWRVFSDVEVSRCGCVLEDMPGASAGDCHDYD